MAGARTAIAGRTLSAPERLGLVGVGAAGVAVVWPALTGATGVALPCPLRGVTGVPCPLCGLTTATVALVRGDIGAAMAANPVALLLAAFVVVVVVGLVLRGVGRLGPPVPWSRAAVTRASLVAVAVATASEVWQLHRLGWT